MGGELKIQWEIFIFSSFLKLKGNMWLLDFLLMSLYFLGYYRAQILFSWIPEDLTNPQPSLFSFKSIIENPKMKVSISTVI